MHYTYTVAGIQRTVPLYPINENICLATFVMFGDVEMTIACAKALLDMAPKAEIIITAESKGIPLAYEMSRQSGLTYIVARKSKKLYMNKEVLSVPVRSITTDVPQILYIDKNNSDVIQNKHVIIVDDVVATGNSIKAIEQLVINSGGIVTSKMTPIAEGEACLMNDLKYLAKLPLFDRYGNML